MTIIRLFIFEPLGTSECTHYHFPVQMGGSADQAFHLELDWRDERLVLRDCGTRSRILVRIGGIMRELEGGEVTTAARELELTVAGTWIRAVVEEGTAHPVAEAAQEAVAGIVGSCALGSSLETRGRALLLLAALARGTVTLRGSLGAARPQDEVTGALARWTQASAIAIELVEELLLDAPAPPRIPAWRWPLYRRLRRPRQRTRQLDSRISG